MITVEVKLPISDELPAVAKTVKKTCSSRGLTASMETTLKSFPGSIHWHFKKEGSPGTVEVTYWEYGRRLWISVHSNRKGDWTTREVRALKAALEANLNS